MPVTDPGALQARRLRNWRQTEESRIAGPEEAAQLIERVGVATLYPVSPEIPNLFHAYVGSPDAATDSGHDSPSGQVYGWRWSLGRREAAFYSAIVRNRPTWVSWTLMPAILRLRAELRTPDEVYDAGELSSHALRLAKALAAAGDALSTGELRRAAGFPTGKEQRAAYLKAIAELDARLLTANVFAPDGEDMYHVLVRQRWPDQVTDAERLTREAALDRFLGVYLPQAVYAVPRVLAKDLQVPQAELRAGLDRPVAARQATVEPLPDGPGTRYVWVALQE